ncbi:MAG: GGDEF domain-containing protein [Thermomonas sp.]|uniref:GGDEF domain-containing protein n=1 Tax=Thermomonas sp. TaxID=1971895 RepID=UPI00262C3AF9|nr:GGDEF domain-containing protein [Thermomonas sp.]MCC7096480.1 GGDEF domain-containing protein [Thermomonas sp.]
MGMLLPVRIEWIDAFGVGVYSLTLVTQLLLWQHRRDRPSHFWLASSALGALLVNITGAVMRTMDSAPVSLATINMLGVASALVSLFELASDIGGKPPTRFARVIEIGLLVPVVLFFFLRNGIFMQVLSAFAVLFLLAAMARAFDSSRSGDGESRVLAYGLGMLFVTLIYDMLSELQVLARVEGMPVLGFSVLYVAAARALSLRYDREYHELQTLRHELELHVHQRTKELETANRRLDLLSRTDALTGLDNRRSFLEEAAKRLRRHPAAMLMIDIDHFKQVNDTHGHDAGDAALRAVADVLHRGLREGDLLARWGGEEFVAMIDAEHAIETAERLRTAVAAAPVEIGGMALQLSASFGVARSAAGNAPDAIIAAADRALYRAKQSGRNRVVIDDDPSGDASTSPPRGS